MRAIDARWEKHFEEVYAPNPRLLVMGEGPHNARIALVGEAPGKEETMQGRPFVGKAGKNLDGYLSIAGLTRYDIYITNVVKFRPVRAVGNANRTPDREEIALFLPWLRQELEALSPRAIVTLGNTPLKALTGTKETIGSVHGQPFGELFGAMLFPLYHPASVIYNRSLVPVYEQDLLELKNILAAL